MPTRLLLLLCLTVHVSAKKPPDVDCLVVNLQYVYCSWNKNGTPDVNYTFYGRFYSENFKECTTYLSENSTNIGCNLPYLDRGNRFQTFYTTLKHGGHNFTKNHELRYKVKLYPPTNVTVKMGSDSNLWFYWNQTSKNCVESDIRYRTNNKKWDTSRITTGIQNVCINLPSSNSLYEFQVRSRISNDCGQSEFWSDWSEPVVWGSNNSTDSNPANGLMAVWTPVLYVFSALFLVVLLLILMHHERLRIILIPVVPKPLLISHDIEDWFQISKDLKDSFNPNYNDRACTVREYSHVSQSDSDNSDSSDSSTSSTSSVTTDQTNCSISVNLDTSSPCSSSISSGLVSSEEQVSFIDQVSQSELGSP